MSNIILGDYPTPFYSQSNTRYANGNPLIRKINRACRSLEPDLALNLDVADYINEKQGSSARDAVLMIVKLITRSQQQHTAINALSLLDTIVKNCGYPVHLQISRKDFLNELVRNFSERPSIRQSFVERKILLFIEEWYQSLCKFSDYKQDMQFIKDMRKLLKYKGYTFPKVKEDDINVLKPNKHLKTQKEILKEQEIAQAAKLEELIRSGKPEDLKEANKLMQVMAGFKEDNAIKAKNAILEEIENLKNKSNLFQEMLSASTVDVTNDTILELYYSLKSSQLKFQHIIEEEEQSGDYDNSITSEILQLNDTINGLLTKFSSMKGDSFEAKGISPGQGGSNDVGDLLDLIDFSSSAEEPKNKDKPATMDDLLGDLGSLNISSSHPQTSNIQLNNSNMDLLDTFSAPSPPPQQKTNTAFDDLLGGSGSKPSTATTVEDFNPFQEFASSPAKPSNELIQGVNDGLLSVSFEILSKSSTELSFKTIISNESSQIIDGIAIKLAVSKNNSLELKPQIKDVLKNNEKNGITQEATVKGADLNKVSVKYIIEYSFGHLSGVVKLI
ncbi:hypothetical protein ACO0OE_003131 [Hanseniaspora uvarum]